MRCSKPRRRAEDDLKPRLPGRAMLHFAAHGRLDDVAPYTSSIVLADVTNSRCRISSACRSDADLAVLSACDTGRGTTTLGGGRDRPDARIAGGGCQALRGCRLWPVDDVAACVTMVTFHSLLKKGDLVRPKRSPRRRTRCEISAEPGSRIVTAPWMARSVQASGRGGADRSAATLATAAIPETDTDDSVVVEEAAGNSARIWAPFI